MAQRLDELLRHLRDELGRFVVDVPSGPIRIVVDGPSGSVRTEWFRA